MVGSGCAEYRTPRPTDSLQAFVEEAVAPGGAVHTDGWPGYERLAKRGYRHRITVLQDHEESPAELLPRVHRVISLLKRWLLGTHQGAVTRPSRTAGGADWVAARLAEDKTLPGMEILRCAHEAGYDGGKSALYELIRRLRPTSAVPVVRFEGCRASSASTTADRWTFVTPTAAPSVCISSRAD